MDTNVLTLLAVSLSIAVGVIADSSLSRITPAPPGLLRLKFYCYTVVPASTFGLLVIAHGILTGTLTTAEALQFLQPITNGISNGIDSITGAATADAS